MKAAAIHGDRTQSQRERALAAFDVGRTRALVATDVAARGIHVEDLPCVVHFDPPADHKDYMHRSGRTGRAGKSGIVVSLVDDGQRQAIRALQKSLGFVVGLDRGDGPSVAGRTGPARPDARGQRDRSPVAPTAGTARHTPKTTAGSTSTVRDASRAQRPSQPRRGTARRRTGTANAAARPDRGRYR